MGRKQNVHCSVAFQGGISRRSAGFTMVEILVTLGIMLLLFGILAGASVRISGEFHKNQVRSMMQALLGANEEFKAKSTLGSVNHDGSAPINWADAKYSGVNSSSERFVVAMRRIPVCEKMMLAALKSSSEAAFERTLKGDKIYDRWGTEIQYRDSNTDLTGTFDGLDNDKLPTSPFPFFVSAGPDKEFGTDDDISTLD